MLGSPDGAEVAQAPFADGGRGVALLLEHLGDGHFRVGDRLLAGELQAVSLLYLGRQIVGAAVVADVGVPGMLARHQHTSRRCTDGIATVVLREPHPFGGQSVDMRRLDLLLPVAAQFGIAQVVGQDVDDVRLFWGRLVLARCSNRCDPQERRRGNGQRMDIT